MKKTCLLLPLLLASALMLAACERKTEAETAQDGAAETLRGPHKGRLFVKDGFALEVTIFEDGVEPEFRVYPTLKGKPLDPKTVALTLTLTRLGAIQTVHFSPKSDYLLGDQVVYEPHSFAVALAATYQQKSYPFSYEQIEWRVRLSAEQTAAAGMEILKAGPARLGDEVELQGEVRVAPNGETVVLAPVAAVVVSAPVALGQAVRQGEVLAVLESRELADLKRAYLEARERAALAESTFQREAQLWKEKITPEQDYLAAKSAKAEAAINLASSRAGLMAFGVSDADLRGLSLAQPGNLSRLVLRAPRSGRITARELAPGQRVTPDSALFTIADLDSLVAVLSATSSQLEGIKPGQPASIVLVNGERRGSGKVTIVSPQFSETNRAAAIYVALDKAAQWRPGQFVKARITRAQKKAAVVVSNEALQSFRDWTVVFAKYGDDFEVRPVTVGARDSQRSEILEGLSAGQEYVGKNSFLLKADIGKSEAAHDH